MRHRCKVDHLGRPADQRNALIRSLATSLFTHDEIMTTLVRAKALKKEADRIISLAKRGDVHAMRQVRKLIYHSYIADEAGQEIPERQQKAAKVDRALGRKPILKSGKKTKFRFVTEERNGKTREIPQTVLRRIFTEVGPRFKERNGGYVRVIQAPPRRGDAAPMALVQLVD